MLKIGCKEVTYTLNGQLWKKKKDTWAKRLREGRMCGRVRLYWVFSLFFCYSCSSMIAKGNPNIFKRFTILTTEIWKWPRCSTTTHPLKNIYGASTQQNRVWSRPLTPPMSRGRAGPRTCIISFKGWASREFSVSAYFKMLSHYLDDSQ